MNGILMRLLDTCIKVGEKTEWKMHTRDNGMASGMDLRKTLNGLEGNKIIHEAMILF